jgi:hypothetical protein
MKKHILVEHPTTWHKWKNSHLVLVAKEQHQEKSKRRFSVSSEAITNHFGNTNLEKKDDAQQKKSMEDLFVAKVYMLIFIVKTQWLKCLVMRQNPQVVFPNQKKTVNNMPSLHWWPRPWNNM